jgi:hypothetical protein
MSAISASQAVPPHPKGRRWFRALAWTLGLLVVLVVILYFVATSSGFIKGYVLPRVGQAINAQITVGDASVSPFSQVRLQNLKVQTTGTEPLLSASELLVRYRLSDLLGGKINLEEVSLSSPTVVLVENADGTRNLDPLLKAGKQGTSPSTTPSSGKPVQLLLKKLVLNDATIRVLRVSSGGGRDSAELSHVTLSVTDVQNSQTGSLTLGAELKAENQTKAQALTSLIESKLNLNFKFALGADLQPQSLKGNAHVDITRAAGGWAELENLAGDLDCDVTPTQLNQVALHFQKGGTRLGELRVTGPFDPARKEGRLQVELTSVDRHLLNLVGARVGLDFGTTTINSTNQVQLLQAGTILSVAGHLELAKFQLSRANQTTPPMDLGTDYDVALDQGKANVLLRALTLTGVQRGHPLLRAELASPMTFAWGNVANGVGDSTLKLSLSGLELADWKPFFGTVDASGAVNAQLQLLSQQGGPKTDLRPHFSNREPRRQTG